MMMRNSKNFSRKFSIKQLLLFLLLVCPVLIKAQDKAFNYKAVEGKIKKYIYSAPDSTRYYLNYALGQKVLPDSIRGNLLNIYGIYYMNLGKMDSSIVYYKKSLSALKNYPRIKVMPLMNISVAYRNKGEYDTSFQHLEDGLELCKKFGLKSNQANIYSNMASNYQYMLQYDKAIEYLLKGINLLKNEEDKTYLTGLRQKLANTYMKMENFTFAKDLYAECLASFKAANDIKNHSLTLINYAECVKHMDELDNAKRALKEAIVQLSQVNNNPNLAIAYSKLASIANIEKRKNDAYKNYSAAHTILLQENSLNVVIIAAEFIEVLNAQKKYEEALKIIETTKKAPIFKSANSEDMLRFEVAAAETFKNTHNEKEALEGLTNALLTKDSVTASNNSGYVNEMQAKFQNELQNEKNLTLKAKNNRLQKEVEARSKLTKMYVFASIVLIIMVLLLLRSLWLKSRLTNQAFKSLEAEKSLIETQQEHEHEYANALKEIIDEKQKELSSTALKMADYQNSINTIIEKCGNDATVTDIKQELQHLIKQKDYWKQFEKRFRSLHPEFENTLTKRFYKLTKNDIEFCSLLKLNLSNKEIASLLQISHESAITKKYRIKKKMEINDDAEFEKMLMDI